MNPSKPVTAQAISDKESSFTLGPLQMGSVCCNPQPVIEVENLSLRYGDKTALDKVTLDIYRGCITALIGPSGCGKTSFLSAIDRFDSKLCDWRSYSC
jgi:phosphate transport system ATP-binding protein